MQLVKTRAVKLQKSRHNEFRNLGEFEYIFQYICQNNYQYNKLY